MSSVNPSLGKSPLTNDNSQSVNHQASNLKNNPVKEISINSFLKSQLTATEEDLSSHDINDIENFTNEEMSETADDIDLLTQLFFNSDEGFEENLSGDLINEEGIHQEEQGIVKEEQGAIKEEDGAIKEEQSAVTEKIESHVFKVAEFDKAGFIELTKNKERILENSFMLTSANGKTTLTSVKNADAHEYSQAVNENRIAVRFNNRLVIDPNLIASGRIQLRNDGSLDITDENGNDETVGVENLKPEEFAALTITFRNHIIVLMDLQYEFQVPNEKKHDDNKSITDNLVNSQLKPPNIKEKQTAEANETISRTPLEQRNVRDKDKLDSEKAGKEKWAKELDEKASERTKGAVRQETHKHDIQIDKNKQE